MSAEVHQYIFAKSTSEACAKAIEETGIEIGKAYLAESVSAQQDPSSPKYYATMISLSDRWQPIETAPKDGTRILACNKHGEIQIVTWDNGSTPGFTGKFTGYLTNPGWLVYVDGQSGFNHYESLSDATHWMPLPKLPEPKPCAHANLNDTNDFCYDCRAIYDSTTGKWE